MKKITQNEVLDLVEYERQRQGLRQRVIEVKRARRVHLGDRISLVFENRVTVLGQIHEMIRTERIVEEDAIGHEIEIYNALIPDPGELSATLFIEITDQADIRKELDLFIGLDRPGRLFLSFEQNGRSPALFEEGHSKEERISAVQYVRFRLTPQQQEEFTKPGAKVTLAVEHPGYSRTTLLTEQTRASLADDLREA